jgi:Na+/phosphate symporter
MATVLFMATRVAQAVMPFGATLGYALGANLGSGLIANMLTREQSAAHSDGKFNISDVQYLYCLPC